MDGAAPICYWAASLLLGLPLTALLVRNRPGRPLRDEDHSACWRGDGCCCIRSGPFWILACIIMLSAFSENGLVTNLAAILTEHRRLDAERRACAFGTRWRRHHWPAVHWVSHRPLLAAAHSDIRPSAFGSGRSHACFRKYIPRGVVWEPRS